MTKKAAFNADEWSTIVQGPLLAGARVIAADRGGTIRESLALGKIYSQARQQHGHSELLDELVSAPPALDPNAVQGADDIATVTTSRLTEALQILQDKASPDEVDAYKNFVISLAQAAATAHREGGFLGIGAKQVSEREQRALDEITATLQRAPA